MSSINQRMAWKESRLLAPICIACLGLLGLLLVAGQPVVQNSKDYTEFAGNLFMSFGCIAGLAFGILMFVFEREAGSDMFLEILPVDGRAVGRTKLFRTFIFFAIYLFVGLLMGAAALAIYEGGIPSLEDKQWPGFWIAMIVLVPTQTLLWSLLCSMTFRSGLYATIVSAALAAICMIFIALATSGWTSAASQEYYVWNLLGNAAICVALGIVVWHSSPIWLRGRKRTFKSRAKFATAKASLGESVPCAYPWRALLWQNVRRCWIPWLIGAIGLLTGSYLIGSFIQGRINQSHNHHYFSHQLHDSVNFAQWLFILTGAWTGILMFSGDQSKSNFLFFQQQTDYPRKVWLSRLCILASFLPVVFIAAIFVSPNLQIFYNVASYQNQSDLQSLGLLVQKVMASLGVFNLMLIFLAAAGLAQLATITFRTGSGVVAFVVTIALCILLFVWQHEISSRLGSSVWFLGPITVATFLATWWQAPRWISGRRKKTAAIVAFSTCSLVAIAIWGTWIWQRANEFHIPLQSIQWTAFANAGDLESQLQQFPQAAKLGSAFKEIQDPEEASRDFPNDLSAEQLKAYFSKNEDCFAKISDCLRDEHCGLFLNPRSETERKNQKRRLLNALKAVTLHRLNEDDPKATFEALIDELRASWWVAATPHLSESVLERIWEWTSSEGLSPKLIRDAIDQLAEEELFMFDHESKVFYRESVFEIERELGALDGLPAHGDFSWEVERSRRWNLYRISTADSPYWWLQQTHGESKPDPKTHVVDTTLNVHLAAELSELRNLFQYTQVRLALVGWKIENKQWPKSLDELKETWIFDHEHKFVYSAKGLDDRVFFTPEHHWGSNNQYATNHPLTGEWIEPNQPFLLPWSGAIGPKRAFYKEVYDEKRDVTRPSNKTEFIYWIPTGPDSDLRFEVKRYLLK